MIKFTEIVKKYKIIIFLSLLVGAIIVLKLSIRTNEKNGTQIPTIFPTTTPRPTTNITPPPQSNFQNIVPGTTTRKDLEQTLGKPTNIFQTDKEMVYQYPSSVKNWPNEISITKDNQKVKLIKNYFPDETFQNLIQKLGNSSANPLYGPDSVNGFLTYVWPEQGLATVANNQSGIILEIWYFSPTTLEEFLKDIGKNLSTSPLENF